MIKILPNVNRAEPEEDRQYALTAEDLNGYINDAIALNPLLNIIDCNNAIEKEELVRYFFKKCKNPKAPKICWFPYAENNVNDIVELSRFESQNYYGVDYPEIFIHTSMDSILFNDLLEDHDNEITVCCNKKPIKRSYETETREYEVKVLGFNTYPLKNVKIFPRDYQPGLDEPRVYIFDIAISTSRYDPLSQIKLFYFVCPEFDFMIDVVLSKGFNLTHLIRPDAGEPICGWSYTNNKLF